MRYGFLQRVLALCLALVLLIPVGGMGEEGDISSEWIEGTVPELEEAELDALPEEGVPAGESPEGPSPGEPDGAAEDNVGDPQDRQITISGSAYESANIGDTLRVYVNGAGAGVSSWKSSKTKVATVSYNGEYATVKAVGSGSAKLTAKLSNKKKLTLNLTVTDRYQPSSIAFSESEILLAVGDACDLAAYIELTPDTARTTYTWKSSSKKIAKVDASGRVTALKPGTATVTVTTKNKKKASIRVEVLANKVSRLSGTPTGADYYSVEGGWSLWPLSVEMLSGGSLACEFYLLNGTGDKASQIENLALTLSAGSRENVIARHYFSKAKVSCKKKSCKAFKITFPASAVFNHGLFLPDYTNALYFDLYSTSGLRMKAGKKYYDFIPTHFPIDEPEALVEEIHLDHDSVTMEIGEQVTITATAYPESAANKAVEWSSSDSGVAAVRDGEVTAVSEGEAIIRATARDGGGASASCRVIVSSGTFTVEMMPPTLSLNVGESGDLFAVQNPLATVIVRQVWSSSDEAVARVDGGGRVTAISAGTARVRATLTSDSGVAREGVCDVTVTEKPVVRVSNISLGMDRLTIEVGQTEMLMAAVEPDAAADKTLIWTSSDEGVVAMDRGTITGLSVGSATVTVAAADGDARAQCVVNVIESPVGIGSVGNVLAAADDDGGIVVMWYQATGCDGYRVRYHRKGDDAWASIHVEGSDVWQYTIPASALEADSVYEVSVCGTRGSDATTSPDYAEGPYSHPVTVMPTGYVQIRGLSLSATRLNVEKGGTLTLRADIEPANATNQSLQWISSDTSVATVSEGVITGVDTGTVTITAIAGENAEICDSIELEIIPENNPRPIEPPQNVALSATENRVFVSWSAVSGAKGYRVYYRREADIASLCETVAGGNRLSTTLSNLEYDMNYDIHVTAYRDTVESGHTGDQRIRTEARPVVDQPVIQNLIVSGDCVYLNWMPVSGTIKYVVLYREEGVPGAFPITPEPDAPTECLATGLKRNKQYYFCVTAIFEDETLQTTDWVEAQTQQTAGEALAASTSLDSVDLTVGGTHRLEIVSVPQGGQYTGAEWESSDSSVATVDSTGLIRARANGSATITMTVTTASGRRLRSHCYVNVGGAKYRALLIGQCAFGSKEYDRPQHKDDVAKMNKMLSSRKGGNGSRWQIQTRFDRSKDEVRQDIEDALGDAGEMDVSLFFIATHGNSRRDYYDRYASALTCYNRASSIRPDELAEWLGAVKGKVIVIISACGSGGFIAEPPANGNAAISNQSAVYSNFDPEALDQAFVEAFMDSDEAMQSNAGDLRGHTTAQTKENKFYVLTSSRFQELSFTGHLVEWLTVGVGTSGKMKADTKYAGNGDGYLTLHELYTYISKVGDNTPILSSEDQKEHYQHVQVYPAGSDFIMFRQ